mmetsp:Transcript_25296/g.50648  ORF Transcript_25296/g.50648 Transcript_25296/m.50648 type:complete len:889 (+) Transcript_25296:36-2702(+)
MIIKHNAILILSTSFLGSSITAADSTTAQRRLQLPPLQQTFSARGAPPNPLPNCHGDCDNDSHCAGDLVCFQRFGYEEVPGCSGSGFRKVDFCAERPTENTLWMKGNNGRPSSSFPLGLCEGDCDTDAECGPGLVCEYRDGDEPIPGCIGDAVPGEDYCRPAVVVSPAPTPAATPPPTAPPTSLQVVFTGIGAPPNPLPECHGDCDDDSQCEGDLVCFQRSGTEAVPNCPGDATSGVDFCAVRATENTVWLKGDNGSPSANFPLGLCEGDCDYDVDCQPGLVCQQRTGTETIPGCIGVPEAGEDYCRVADPTAPPTPAPTDAVTPPPTPVPTNAVTPPVTPEPTNGVTPNPTSLATPNPTNAPPPPTPPTSTLQLVFTDTGAPPNPLPECHGDCDDDSQCEGSLVCFQRSGTEVVPGCTGTATSGADFCAVRATQNTVWLKGDNGSPSANFPLGLCEGDCDSDANCQPGLICKQRTGTEPIPNCIGVPEPGEDYCYDPNGDAPSPSPGPPPTYAPNTFGATYVPGDLSQPCDGGKLMLSRGMDCRLLTTAGEFVQYDTSGQSAVPMHEKADGAAVIAHPTDGGWYYTSNSEGSSGSGGVGTLRFNAQGEVIGYKMDLEGTTRNCGGGKTYWDTWVTCEEDGSQGYCWEVDPFTGHTAQTNAVIVGGNYESFAYDDQDPDVEARFFTTEDSGNGPLVRYTPTMAAFNTGDSYDILTSPGGTHDYLVLNADGTFDWNSSESAGASSASTYFPNAEGIDVINRQLFFISKVNKELFELDLAAKTWIVTSTVSGAFDRQPDQIQKVVGDSEFLYFCEDGGAYSDIHGRNRDGEFFTIVRGDGYGTETSGLAFSPDNKYMYVAFQGNSNVYAFWRTDGLDFGAVKADIKYHQV